MRKTLWIAPMFVVSSLAFGGTLRAQEGHHHAGPAHGDEAAQASHYHFEATFSSSGLKLVAHGRDMKSIDASGLKATATFYHPNSPKPWFTRELRSGVVARGLAPQSLGLAMDLSKVPPKGAKVTFQVTGLPDPDEPTATVTVPFALADEGKISVSTATKADEQAIAAAKVCPVSGEALGEMGPPIKVTRGGKTIFLCCKGCLKDVQKYPDKFFDASAASPHEAGGHEQHAH
jgi:hypothetical protein